MRAEDPRPLVQFVSSFFVVLVPRALALRIPGGGKQSAALRSIATAFFPLYYQADRLFRR